MLIALTQTNTSIYLLHCIKKNNGQTTYCTHVEYQTWLHNNSTLNRTINYCIVKRRDFFFFRFSSRVFLVCFSAIHSIKNKRREVTQKKTSEKYIICSWLQGILFVWISWIFLSIWIFFVCFIFSSQKRDGPGRPFFEIIERRKKKYFNFIENILID